MMFGRQLNSAGTFWDHLESLRWSVLRSILVLAAVLVVVFTQVNFVFDRIIMPPTGSGFITYRLMCRLGEFFGMPSLCPGTFQLQIVNYEMSGQFFAHLSTSFTAALVLTVPYLLYEIWRFVAPALYHRERKYTALIFFSTSALFYIGALVSYYIIFPLSVRFLGTYEVSASIPNHISLQSYLGTLYVLIFAMGILFELPVLTFLLSSMGIIHRALLRKVRSYAMVVILILAALITPTTDPLTMLFVAAPVYLLYELSILVCRSKNTENTANTPDDDVYGLND